MEHLTELRDRLIKVVLAVVVGMVISFLLYNQIFDFLLEPYEDIANSGTSLTGVAGCSRSTRSRASASA